MTASNDCSHVTRAPNGRERGVILVTTLVFLLLIALLGLSSLEASITQERMIGNAHHYSLASQSAETALFSLERQLIDEGVGGAAGGLELIDIQVNSQDELSQFDSSSVRVEVVSIGGVPYSITEKGGVSDNSNFHAGSSLGTGATSYAGIDYLDDSEPHQLNAQPLVIIEQGRFIPDDLSVEAAAEYRGRQEFIVFAQAVSRNTRITSVVQTSVLVRTQ
ncbi:MAG: hypothetical protein COB04_19445 [Gammaproteobacteria bacterium]|nr:MAG: hypothetical protein COB04_19445 [Gammaproteobacteria bacterium]